MIVGIEETTDSRYPETRIVKLRTRARAAEWLAQSPGYAWPGAADAALPPGQQNWHRRFRSAYEMPPGWRMPTAAEIERMRGFRPWEDRRSREQIVGLVIATKGAEIPRVKEAVT